MLELVSMVSSVKIQQLAVPFKELRANSETAKYQSCSELGSQVPSVGTLVPLDSEIQVVAVQNLIEWFKITLVALIIVSTRLFIF